MSSTIVNGIENRIDESSHKVKIKRYENSIKHEVNRTNLALKYNTITMKFFFSGKLAVLLLTVEVYHATSISIRTSSFIETAARSYTGASSSLHYRYTAVNDNNDIEPTILTDMMRGRGRRQEEEVLDNNDIIEIVTYFHLLIMNEMNGDDVDEETISKNLTVLNEAYGGGMENSMYKDCNDDPFTSYETGFRFNKVAETTRMYVTELEDKSFLETIREEELINLYFLLEQGPVKIEDITSSSLEKFLQNQILEEQIMTLVERPLLGVISMVVMRSLTHPHRKIWDHYTV